MSKPLRRRSTGAAGLQVRNIESRQLKDGTTAFYWRSKQHGKRLGMHMEALGTDPVQALVRAVELNERLRAALEEEKNPKVPENTFLE